MSRLQKFALSLILLSFAVAAYFYPRMPEEMASHWNAAGQVDGYLPKFWGLFLMPLMALVLFGLFVLIPKIDPLKTNIVRFRRSYDEFTLAFEIFFLYIYALTLVWSQGWRFDMTAAMMPALALLLYFIGAMIEKAERNYFIGIRTPWTLASDTVWHKTHRRGGKLFKAVALLTALAAFFPAYAIYLMLIPILAVSGYLMIYSYSEFQKEKKSKDDSKR